MFQIEVKTGEEGIIVLRGCSDGTVEFCKWSDVKDTITKEVKPQLAPYKYYASIEQAFAKVARMRIGSCSATSLQELTAAIRQIRIDIKNELGVLNGESK